MESKMAGGNESIIFCIYDSGKILCEMRDYKGKNQPCILGGSIEDIDYASNNYLHSAVKREANEELGVIIQSCDSLGHFDSDGRRFHVLIVQKWNGQIGQYNFDNKNKLVWIDQTKLIDNIELEPLKDILQVNLMKNTQ